jgi:integrase
VDILTPGLHDLRHTYAATTLVNKAKLPLPAVSLLLEHQNARVSAETYGHSTKEAELEGANLWDDTLEKSGRAPRLRGATVRSAG